MPNLLGRNENVKIKTVMQKNPWRYQNKSSEPVSTEGAKYKNPPI